MAAIPLWMNPPDDPDEDRPGRSSTDKEMSAAEARALGIEVR